MKNTPPTSRKGSTGHALVFFAAALLLFSAFLILYHPPGDDSVPVQSSESGREERPNENTTDEVPQEKRCADASAYGECGRVKPLYCDAGRLVSRADLCGCPEGYEVEGVGCVRVYRCSDGTIYGECAREQPLYCLEGTLVNRTDLCGCPEDYVAVGYACESKYELGPTERLLEYTLRGRESAIKINVYKGLSDHLEGLPRYYYCKPECPTDVELELRFLDEDRQERELEKIVEKIKAQTQKKDDQARIAISLVQNIPYDEASFASNRSQDRYPYEVLYDGTGVCSEKSRLLAYLLRALGYGVALLEYGPENHMALGLECPEDISQYGFEEYTYCFVETTAPTIVTDNRGDYVGVGRITSAPNVIVISDGSSFDGEEEYSDALKLDELVEKAEEADNTLSRRDYARWEELVERYGLDREED